MELHKLEYVIRDKDLPIMKDIRDIEDGREIYFTNDYAFEKKMKYQSARDCHREYEPREYWIEMFEQQSGFNVLEYSKHNFGHDSAIVIEAERELTEDEKINMINMLTELYEYFSEIKTIEFDLRLNPSFKTAVEMDGVDVFEEWLYDNVFCQAPEHCDKDSTRMKVKDGVYNMTFTKDVDEYEVRKFVDSFIESDMVRWLEQDVPKKKAKGV